MTDRLTAKQTTAISQILVNAASEGRNYLLEPEVYQILQILGLQVPTYLFVRSPDELAGGVLAEFGSERLIIKVVSGEIPHKTKVGGVRTVVRDRELIRSLMRRMHDEILMHPIYAEKTPKVEGFLLSSFVEYSKDLGNELLIGIKENLAFGPEISFSKGGTDAEHFAKHYSAPNVRLLPLTPGEEAHPGRSGLAPARPSKILIHHVSPRLIAFRVPVAWAAGPDGDAPVPRTP